MEHYRIERDGVQWGSVVRHGDDAHVTMDATDDVPEQTFTLRWADLEDKIAAIPGAALVLI